MARAGRRHSAARSCVPASPRSPLLPGVRPPSSPSHSRSAPHATPVCRKTRPGRVVHPDGRGLGALARSLLTAIPRCTARRAMAARTVRVASAARRPKGPRRSPGALAHSKRGRREASAGAATLRPRRPPCRAPGPRGVRPSGGRSGSSDGLVGFVCPTEFWGHVTPGDFLRFAKIEFISLQTGAAALLFFGGGDTIGGNSHTQK